MKNIKFVVLIEILFFGNGSTSTIQKRQLFREHLIPDQGGKIPESALLPERLVLNRLNQNGLFSPDGFHLEQSYGFYHSPRNYIPKTMKVNILNDQLKIPQVLDTTYLIREPNIHEIYPIHKYPPLPLVPYTSLNLVKQYRKSFNFRNDWNENFSSNGIPTKILAELSPYLRKLHDDVDYD